MTATFRCRASDAEVLEIRDVTFKNGEKPQRNECHSNVKRWVQENPQCKRVCGWLVTVEAIFDKHSVVEEGGVLYDITPTNTPTRFVRHVGSDVDFSRFQDRVTVSNLGLR